jgi:hypothetical protein
VPNGRKPVDEPICRGSAFNSADDDENAIDRSLLVARGLAVERQKPVFDLRG